MAVISFVNPKGGTGKTTSALLLAEQISELGNKVAIVDCDPNCNLLFWQEKRHEQNKTCPFVVHPSPKALDLVDLVEDLSNTNDLVIIDLEGSADQVVTFALARTDMSLIPFKPSPMEARQCARAIHLIKQNAKMSRCSEAFRILFTRANAAIKTHDEKSVISELENNGLSDFILPVKLVERAAYTRIFQNHETISEIKDSGVSNWLAAEKNARDYASAVLDALEKEIQV